MSRFDAATLERALRFVGKPPPIPERGDMVAEAVDIAAGLCRRFESFIAHPYLDPVGVPTVAFGATHYLDGRRVTLKDPPLSREAGERLLQLMLRREYLPQVMRLCPDIDTAGRLAAILDFAYNLGPPKLAGSTLRRRVNAGEWDRVPEELRKWTLGGGVRLRGLVLRREAEASLV